MTNQYCPKGSSFDLMAKKIEKKLAKDSKKPVVITVTKRYEFSKNDWEELKSHLESIWGEEKIVEYFDASDIDYHLSSVKDPTKTTHRIT